MLFCVVKENEIEIKEMQKLSKLQMFRVFQLWHLDAPLPKN